ncbi:YcnI family protein [Micromonospora sp. NPDC000663]|uniref:YcnI family copper-binding membrane protein n=1 Tax=Micromonospora sp. NPDC000663 TaxID=3364218 RepID=UPI0036A3D5C7
MASTDGGGRRRRIVAVTALTAAGLLFWPATAYGADVTTTPSEARQGDAVRLEFSVPEERAGTTTRQIEVRLPADAPVAEVYPMSVDGWAPRISSRTLDKPVTGIHSSRVSTVTTAVTWVRVGQAAPGPARLALSMGPLPQADKLTFEVVQTYADGTVVRWTDADGAHPAPTLTLLPAAGAAGPVGHGGHGAPANGADTNADSNTGGGTATDAAGGSGEEQGSADAMLGAGLLAGLGGGTAIGWLVSRWRRRDPAEDAALAEVTGAEDEATEPAEPADVDRAQVAGAQVAGAQAASGAESAPVGTPVRTG